MQRRRELMTFEHGHWVTATGSIVTFNTPFAKPLRSLKAEFMPVQEGTGDPSPDNVRPIAGWTGTKISHTGANLFGGNVLGAAILGSCTSAAVQTGDIVYLPKGAANIKAATADRVRILESQLPDGQCTIFIKQGENTDATRSLFTVFYTDGTSTSIGNSFYDATAKVWRYPTNSSKSVWFIRMNRDATEPIEYDISKSGVFTGNIALADFVAYTGNTYDVAFPSEAGTVYGGYVDLVTGEVWKDWELKKNSSQVLLINVPNYMGDVSTQFYFQIPARSTNDTRGYVDCAKYLNNSAEMNRDGAYDIWNYDGASLIHMRWLNSLTGIEVTDDRQTRITKIKAYIANNPIHTCTPLATPIMLGVIDPITITTLISTNNIWSTANSNVTAEYWTR